MNLSNVYFLYILVPVILCSDSDISHGYQYQRALPQDVMVDVINNIGLALLEAHNEGNDNNIALSPYGATSVLVALGEGIRGYAAHEIQDATRMPMDVSIVRVGLRDVHRHLKSYFIPKEGFLAGLILSTDKVPLIPEYENVLRFYGYGLESFNNPIYPETFESTTVRVDTNSTTTGTATEHTTKGSDELTEQATEMSTPTTNEPSKSTTALKTDSPSTLIDEIFEQNTASDNIEKTTIALTTETRTGTSTDTVSVLGTSDTSKRSTILATTVEATTEHISSVKVMLVSRSTYTTTENNFDSSTTIASNPLPTQTTTNSEVFPATSAGSTFTVAMRSDYSTETMGTNKRGRTTKNENDMTTKPPDTTTLVDALSTLKDIDTLSTAEERSAVNAAEPMDNKKEMSSSDRTTLITLQTTTTSNLIDVSTSRQDIGESTVVPARMAVQTATSASPLTEDVDAKERIGKLETTIITRKTNPGNQMNTTTESHAELTNISDTIAGESSDNVLAMNSTGLDKKQEAASTTLRSIDNSDNFDSSTNADTFATLSENFGTTLNTEGTTANIIVTSVTKSISTSTSKYRKGTTGKIFAPAIDKDSVTTFRSTNEPYTSYRPAANAVIARSTLSYQESTPSTFERSVSRLETTLSQDDEDHLSESSYSNSENISSDISFSTSDSTEETNPKTSDYVNSNENISSNEIVNYEGVERAIESSDISTADYHTLTDGSTEDYSSLDTDSSETYEVSTISSQYSKKFDNTPLYKTRKTRSVIDYIIARYHDSFHINNKRRRHYEPGEDLSFLVSGRIREPNINFMTYDTVLPFAYISILNAMALSFPLDSSKYYLLLLLPVDEGGIDRLIYDLKRTIGLREIISSLQYTHVKAIIPSFMLKGYVILTPTLQKLGIRKIFEPRHADFSLMTEEKDIYVTNIEQAVTVTIRNYVDPEKLPSHRSLQQFRPIEFKADHPFLYFVMDSDIHVTLMAGKIVNPLNSRIR